MQSVSRRRARSSFAPLAVGLVVGVFAVTGLTASASAADESARTAARTETVGAVPLSDIEQGTRSALDFARAAVTVATNATAEATASGLDLGPEGATIDTDDLRTLVDQLSAFAVTPALLLPALTDQTVAETKRVVDATAALRDRLDAALAQKAAAEAAQRETEAAAAQAAAEAAAAAQRDAERAAAAAAAAALPGNSVEGAKATARQLALANYGWGGDQFSCLEALWNRESGWNYRAYNASSGATGIPQALPGSKMASAGADWQTNAATQIAWGLGYIAAVYGTPCGAWGHSQSVGWY